MGKGRRLAALALGSLVLLAHAVELRGGILQRAGGSVDLQASQNERTTRVSRPISGLDGGTVGIVAPTSEFDPLSGAEMAVAYDICGRGQEARISLDVSGEVWLPWSSADGSLTLDFRTNRLAYYRFTVELGSISNYQIVRLDDVEASLWYDWEHTFGGTMAPVPPDFAPATHYSLEGLLAPGWHTLTAAGRPFMDRSTPVALAFSAEVTMRAATRSEQGRLAGGPVVLAMPAELRAQPAPEPATLLLLLAAGALPAARRLGRR